MSSSSDITYVPRVGGKLPGSEAIVLAWREKDGGGYIVLAVQPNDLASPFVTWAVSPVDASRFWGHYDDDLGCALADYARR